MELPRLHKKKKKKTQKARVQNPIRTFCGKYPNIPRYLKESFGKGVEKKKMYALPPNLTDSNGVYASLILNFALELHT